MDIASQIFLVLGSLAIVVGAIFVAALLARRYGGQSLGVGTTRLRLLGALSVGQRERVVLIEVQGQRLLLGVAAGSVRTLQQLPTSATPEDTSFGEPAVPSLPNFATLLRGALGLRQERP